MKKNFVNLLILALSAAAFPLLTMYAGPTNTVARVNAIPLIVDTNGMIVAPSGFLQSNTIATTSITNGLASTNYVNAVIDSNLSAFAIAMVSTSSIMVTTGSMQTAISSNLEPYATTNYVNALINTNIGTGTPLVWQAGNVGTMTTADGTNTITLTAADIQAAAAPAITNMPESTVTNIASEVATNVVNSYNHITAITATNIVDGLIASSNLVDALTCTNIANYIASGSSPTSGITAATCTNIVTGILGSSNYTDHVASTNIANNAVSTALGASNYCNAVTVTNIASSFSSSGGSATYLNWSSDGSFHATNNGNLVVECTASSLGNGNDLYFNTNQVAGTTVKLYLTASMQYLVNGNTINLSGTGNTFKKGSTAATVTQAIGGPSGSPDRGNTVFEFISRAPGTWACFVISGGFYSTTNNFTYPYFN